MEWIKGQVNEVYRTAGKHSPRFASQAGLKVLEILKLLPRTNCKTCGYATCMAYAAALREGEISLYDCAPLGEERYQARQRSFRPIWRASAGAPWMGIKTKSPSNRWHRRLACAGAGFL